MQMNDTVHGAPLAEADTAAQESVPARPEEGETPPPASSGAAQTLSPAGYEDVKWPQGVDAPAQMLEEFKQLAQELHLSAQTAQKLVDWECARARGLEESQQSQHQQLLEKWAQASKEMLGPHYQADMEMAVRAADKFGGEALRKLLEETGLGNHPVIVKTFCQIGRATAEDCSLGGKESSLSTDKTFAEALYGSN